MNEFACALFVALAVLALLQMIPALIFAFRVLGRRDVQTPDESLPKTAVVLCLRGADPFLEQCLSALLEQDHPRYEVHVVVDSRDDPAWRFVQERIPVGCRVPVRMSPLRVRHKGCHLKTSSICQAVADLDDSFEVVAMLDADTLPHANWLRTLVSPLASPEVGVTTGNRWYIPPHGHWGSLIRFVWNVPAVVSMYFLGQVWGGSLAMKKEVFRQPQFVEKLSKTPSEDNGALAAARKVGLQLRFVPSLMMVNREECDVGACHRFVMRQLVWTRLCHPRWPSIVAHGLITTVLIIAAVILGPLAIVQGNWSAAAWSSGGWGVYLITMTLLIAVVERRVCASLRARGEPVDWLTPSIFVRLLAAIPLTQWLYAYTLLRAVCLRRVEWRGVKYQLTGPRTLVLSEYRPFRDINQRSPAASI